MANEAAERRLRRPIDERRDHVRGGGAKDRRVTVLIYGDYLCPYCRRLRDVLERLRQALGERMAYVFRHFPNERAHPGAELMSLGAEAAGRQGRFWEMHDALYRREPPLDRTILLQIAASLRLDLARFERDLDDPELRQRVEEDLADGRRNGVTATPTIFVDGLRYDGAWDFYSMLEALERPVGAQVKRTARAFANLPASAGLALLVAAGAALVLANSPFAASYEGFVNAPFAIGPTPAVLSLSIASWCSEGLLAIFFLILGLEIRREAKAGSFADRRAAVAPVVAAAAGVAAPALFYLALNGGPTAAGWSASADTGIAFTLGVLALFGGRVSAGLKLFVAAYGVADDVLAMFILAVIYPRGIHADWLLAAAGAVAAMALLNRWRVYAAWPYLAATLALWFALHLAGLSGAISGIALAAFLPTRPVPMPGPLLAQAASALAELEHAEQDLKRGGDTGRRLDREPVWDWASRNLTAASERLLSPAERTERALEPWSTYVVLPLFAFTAAGVPLVANLAVPHAWPVFAGVALGLAVAKPLGIVLAVWGAIKARVAIFPDATRLAFLGAAFLCGIADPLSLLIIEQAFQNGAYAAVAKIGVLAGSALAATFGAITLAFSRAGVTEVEG
ncbi:MAG TPA: Na+/H+ antiporter NhaA [Caulobacteraceae bacterium]|nr:Na+/H+ antiporter NhaA [Caulobacteraceae bacterium]